jgi:uracil-DNA glycosylase
MTTRHFNLKNIDPSWQACVKEALTKMDPAYLQNLLQNENWIPGPDKIFNAFSLPLDQVKFILFGESPYPRAESANGYAFWDDAVHDIWTSSGLSKPVNRATSLRNIIKMLLVAEGLLKSDKTSQSDIALLDKSSLLKTNKELFQQLLQHGFLLLNISLVLHDSTLVKKDALSWQPFIKHILHFILNKNPNIQLILLGKVANTIDQLLDLPQTTKFYAEHPYNLSFIQNRTVLDFFSPLHLLKGSSYDDNKYS